MLANATIEGLRALGLDVMAQGLLDQRELVEFDGLGFEERLGLLVDREVLERQNRRMTRALKSAKLRTSAAVIEDLDFGRPRGLDKAQILGMADAHWVDNHHVAVVVGPTGVGKTYLACALAHSAIRHGHTALYVRAPRLFDEVAIARADGRLVRLMASWARVGVLVIDDLLIRPLSADQAADLLEVIEERAGRRSTIITSQLPIELWHEALGDATIADAVLDRLLEKAHRIELHGESLRRPLSPDVPTDKKSKATRQQTPSESNG
jgi:DNA replication protein DnaC